MKGFKGASATLTGVCAAMVIVIGLSGCGHGTADPPATPLEGAPGTSLEERATNSAQSGLDPPASTARLQSNEAVAANWSTPNGEILDAFAHAAEALEGATAYFPSRLPQGAQLLQAVEDHTGAQVVVSVATDCGELEFLQLVKGDIGDLPAEAVRLGDGRSASVYQLMGGLLVQWAEGSDWYGVYATGFGKDEVLMVAELMEAW